MHLPPISQLKHPFVYSSFSCIRFQDNGWNCIPWHQTARDTKIDVVWNGLDLNTCSSRVGSGRRRKARRIRQYWPLVLMRRRRALSQKPGGAATATIVGRHHCKRYCMASINWKVAVAADGCVTKSRAIVVDVTVLILCHLVLTQNWLLSASNANIVKIQSTVNSLLFR